MGGERGGVLDAPDEGGGGGNGTMVGIEGLVDTVVEVVGVEEVGGGVLLEAAVEVGVVCTVEVGVVCVVVTTVMGGVVPSSVVTRSHKDDTLAFMSSREAVTELSAWRMEERSGVAVFAGGCSPARLRAMLSTESARKEPMLILEAPSAIGVDECEAAGEDGGEEVTAAGEAVAATAAMAAVAAAAAALAAARWEFLVLRRERLFTWETVIGDETTHWVEMASADEASETDKGLSAVAQISHDLVATCALQQDEIFHLQQTVDQMLARLQALEKQPVAAAAAGPSNLATRVQALEDDVSNIKRVHQDFRTSQQAMNLQLETQVQAAATVTPAVASSRRPPKLDDLPVFCDQSKTDPIPWWRQFTLRLDMHHVLNNDRHACLYHGSGGACQAWLDNILTSHGIAVSELHTKLTWQELTDAWHKRFQVQPPDLQAMEKLNKLHQNSLLSQDWITEFQRLAFTPDLPLSFRGFKHLFIMRSCPSLQNALTQIAKTLETSDKLFSASSRIILTNVEARNAGRSSATSSSNRPKPKVACIAATSPTSSTEAATPNEGDVLAAARDGGRSRNNHGRDKTKTQSTSSPGTGSAADEPWLQYGLSANNYHTRLRYHYCLCCTLPHEGQTPFGKVGAAEGDSTPPSTPSEAVVRTTALSSEAYADVGSLPLSFEDFAARLVPSLDASQGQDTCAAFSPSEGSSVSSSSSRDSASVFNEEVLDPLTPEDFAWVPLPTTGSLPGPQSAALCALLQEYLSFHAPPTLPTVDEVAVGDMLGYAAKVAREFALQRRTAPAASSTATAVPVTTGALPACPVQGALEPLADYLRRLQAFTDAVATAKAQQEAAEAERQRLANEAAAQTQRTAEADAPARDRRNAASTESLIQNENQWTTLLQGMIFVPTDAQADPTPAEAERSNLANLMLSMMRGVMWNNKLLQAHLLTERQHKQKQQQDIAALTAAVRAAATQQQQQHQLLNSTLACINSIEAKASAAPGCTTDTAKQLGERIDHVVTIIGELGAFTSPATISSTVAAIKTDITKLQSQPATAAKVYKMPRFNIGKFEDYNKTNALTWWQAFLTKASCHKVPAEDMMKVLYLQLNGGAQAWTNHLAVNKGTTIAELHKHLTWEDFEQLWFTRFMVRNVLKAAMNEVYTCSQGSMPTRDWTIKWQKIVTTPGFDLSFPNQRSEFFSRSCAGLRTALGNEYDYASFQSILDRANLVIQTDDKAANEKQSQPHYVAKQGHQRPTHNNAVISEESVDLHAAAASSSDGGTVAALPPKRPKRVRKKPATQATTSTGTGQQPWTAYNTTKEVFDLPCTPSASDPVSSPLIFEDSTAWSRLEELDPLTREDFTWMPLPSTGTLPRPHCNALMTNLRSYLHATVPAPLTDDGVAVVDLRSYLAKIDREYATLRYAETDAPLLYIRIQIGKATCSALIDCGASRNFMSQAFMAHAGLGPRVRWKTQPTQVTLADGRTQKSIDRCVDDVPVYFAPLACEPVSFDILDTKFDMILGMSWLHNADHPVNFHDRTVHIRDRNGVLVPCTVATPHTSIACHVVSVARIRDAIARNDVEEMGLVFLHALPSPDGPAASPPDPRISHLLDEYGDVFEAPTGTVPDRPIRHGITLEAGAVPSRGCIYRMSEEELEVLRAQLDDLLDKGWIRPSCSPYGAPVLFVRKKNKDLRLCIDYRKLNAQTVKNAGPLPWIDDLLERLGGATYFLKLDLKSGYHQIEIQPQDRVLIYLDDILVYSRTLDEHIVHLRAVLDCLRLAKYKANLDKCEFAKQELEYLGHYVTPKGIRPLADKIQAIVDWPEPHCTTDVRSFMGLAGYYQRFVESYWKVAAPLSRLQSPKVPFEFDDAAHGASTTLKAAMQAAPALRIYDPTLPTQVTTDASGYGIGAVLEQCHEDGWHPVEYFSQKVPLVNTLEDARKKELLAFITVLKWWCHFLLGRRRFKWNTDNNPLTFYKTQDTATNTIGRWMYYIDQFDFDPCHILGPANRAADALSRRPDFCAIVTTTFDLDDDL
ncbi:hypothetical protein CBR_g31120 [Chara braunii]|uniref:Reverse transcriptase domain-containing protein n=1 Tax=Chara braunii TaxID=69332 RepID=A0A388LEC3_CHABU|nr:hypothetical protein CBR_g31120 [Chara braunii]|eukprot:GBG80660.1 hypothetical protein CBR_g31120 [Chara braunii]